MCASLAQVVISPVGEVLDECWLKKVLDGCW